MLEKDKQEINNIMNEITDDISYIKEVSDSIVEEYTSVLDDIMRDIKDNVIDKDIVSDDVLEKYFMELTNAIYFLGSKGEFLGMYEDISKTNAKLKYNDAFSENVLNANMQGKKATVDENRIFAEKKSINETIVSSMYARSFKIIKTKIESANEMIKTLSKIITKRMNEKDFTIYGNQFSNEGDN